MKADNFTRKQFIASISLASLLLAISNPLAASGAWFGEGVSATSDLLFYTDAKGKRRPVTTLAEWRIKRQQILDGLQAVMGHMPPPARSVHMEVLQEQKEEQYTRLTIRLMADGESIPAFLYLPAQKGSKRRFPAMLALHPTGADGKRIVDDGEHNPNRGYAKELAQRGYVVIAPDYPSFGDLSNYDFANDRYQSGTMKSIFDNRCCLDLLQSRGDVDADRMGVIGHSLGGHGAMFTGAFDTRLKVIVSSCGWTLLDYYNAGEDVTKRFGGPLGPWAQDRYMPLMRDKYQLDVKQVPFDFDGVIAALAPRAFFSSSPLRDSNFNVEGVRKGIAQASEVYRFLKAKNQLQVRYPDCTHDFPPDIRQEAYRFIDRALGVFPVS